MQKVYRRGKPTLRHFRRELSPAERAVLVAAGAGDPAQGWRTIVDVYRQVHMAGWRLGMSLSDIKVTMDGD